MWFVRVVVLITAILWIKFLLNVISDKPIPVITDIGRSTLVIFLGHGFIVRFLRYFNFSTSTFVAFSSTIVIIAFLYLVQVIYRKIKGSFAKK